ncbi:HAMP domain-containing sensor histidine kinase [Terribacillus saccharophilus]|uniref:sensor histidine kinase n=1 Tax=Terribacillus saccharophilus TaxID=361277 RepID=UPI003981FD08
MKLKNRYRLLLLIALISVPLMLVTSGIFIAQLYEMFFKHRNDNLPFHESLGYPVMLVVCFIGLVVMAFLFSISINALLRKIALLQTTIKELAASAAIPETLPVERRDELGDLTEAVNLLIERTTYRELELKQRRKMETEMLQKLKHDINTPLTALRLQLFYLEDELQDKNALVSMYQQIEYIADLSSELPFHASEGLSEAYVISEEVDMRAFCQLMIDKWSYLYSMQNIQIRFYDGEKPVMWIANELWLQRMFDNIFQNTLKHAKADNLTLTLTAQSISIADDGKGFRVDEVKQGLGLKIIKDTARILHLEYQLIANKEGTRYLFQSPETTR